MTDLNRPRVIATGHDDGPVPGCPQGHRYGSDAIATTMASAPSFPPGPPALVMLLLLTSIQNWLSVEDQLLLTLQYWHEYRTQFHIDFDFEVSEAAVCHIITTGRDHLGA
jgi:hypothetical protein